MGLERKRAEFFARLAQGSLGLAGQWAQLERGGVELFGIKQGVVKSLAGLTLAETLNQADRMLQEARQIAAGWAGVDKGAGKTDLNRRAQKTLIQVLISALQDVITCHVFPARALVNSDQRDRIVELAGRFDAEQAARGIHDACEAMHWIESSVNEKLIFERLLLRLTHTGS